MMRSMMRWALAGCMALAALGAVAVLDVGSPTAEAAPSVSSFAGSYVGTDPRAIFGSYGWWAVTISRGGRITGSFVAPGSSPKGSMNGQVGADGSYSLAVSVAYLNPEYGPRDHRKWLREDYESTGKLASDIFGNIVGTEDANRTFSWLRQ